eukprot:3663828-Rhodomonas_salina.3
MKGRSQIGRGLVAQRRFVEQLAFCRLRCVRLVRVLRRLSVKPVQGTICARADHGPRDSNCFCVLIGNLVGLLHQERPPPLCRALLAKLLWCERLGASQHSGRTFFLHLSLLVPTKPFKPCAVQCFPRTQLRAHLVLLEKLSGRPRHVGRSAH